ncbi:MAG TPA: response regulator transcription factor [Ferruginibacter sp.]|nr:DNA-binding response regulator [Chitinophagaceae bacterium]HRI25981.1 response regulator transcription factor [Ferruginibacter sp.]
MPYSIAIVDDHLLIAKAIGSVIGQFPNYQVLYEVENGSELTERFRQKKNIPDIVLLDISMPVMDGFETAAWLKQHHPGVKILVLSMQGDDESLVKMIKAGAIGYLNKNVHPAELEKALDALIEKGFYYPDWATSRVLHALATSDNNDSVKLSEREIEFLKYSCTEMTYKEIGEKMFCSARTVESYRDSLFEKLSVKTRVALALYAVKSGLHKL